MNKIYPGNLAYPVTERRSDGEIIMQEFGLTIRQRFAAMAMQGIVSNQMMTEANDLREIAERAVILADELIEALNK